MDQDAGAAPAAQGCGSCLAEKSLLRLADALKDAGLHVSFGTCHPQTMAGHYDSVSVTNPLLP